MLLSKGPCDLWPLSCPAFSEAFDSVNYIFLSFFRLVFFFSLSLLLFLILLMDLFVKGLYPSFPFVVFL